MRVLAPKSTTHYPLEKGSANHSSWAEKLAHGLQAKNGFCIFKGLRGEKNQKKNDIGWHVKFI